MKFCSFLYAFFIDSPRVDAVLVDSLINLASVPGSHCATSCHQSSAQQGSYANAMVAVLPGSAMLEAVRCGTFSWLKGETPQIPPDYAADVASGKGILNITCTGGSIETM